jgi:hypothetical protein
MTDRAAAVTPSIISAVAFWLRRQPGFSHLSHAAACHALEPARAEIEVILREEFSGHAREVAAQRSNPND